MSQNKPPNGIFTKPAWMNDLDGGDQPVVKLNRVSDENVLKMQNQVPGSSFAQRPVNIPKMVTQSQLPISKPIAEQKLIVSAKPVLVQKPSTSFQQMVLPNQIRMVPKPTQKMVPKVDLNSNWLDETLAQMNAAQQAKAKNPNAKRPNKRQRGGGQGDEVAQVENEPVEDDKAEDQMGVAETYADYKPAKLNFGQPHPDAVVETASLSSVEPTDITYKLSIPKRVINKGLLSALQLESIVYASQAHQHLLEDGSRAGFLIGEFNNILDLLLLLLRKPKRK